MTEIFSERYGAPTTREANSLFWTGKAASVTLHRYRENTPSEGWALLTTNEDLDESARLRHEQTKGAAKGL